MNIHSTFIHLKGKHSYDEKQDYSQHIITFVDSIS